MTQSLAGEGEGARVSMGFPLLARVGQDFMPKGGAFGKAKKEN